MAVIQHKKLNISAELKDFSQSQYEIYHAEIVNLTKGVDTYANSSGAVVRAAVKANFLLGIQYEAVGDMSPAAVTWLTKKIHEHVTLITTPPKEELDDPN